MQAASGLGLGLHPIDWTLGFDAFVHVLVRLFAARLGAGRVDAGTYLAQQTALSPCGLHGPRAREAATQAQPHALGVSRSRKRALEKHALSQVKTVIATPSYVLQIAPSVLGGRGQLALEAVARAAATGLVWYCRQQARVVRNARFSPQHRLVILSSALSTARWAHGKRSAPARQRAGLQLSNGPVPLWCQPEVEASHAPARAKPGHAQCQPVLWTAP